MSGMRVMHVIEAMHVGGAEALVVEHVRGAGSGVDSLVCALNRGGPALDAAAAAGALVRVLDKGRVAFEKAFPRKRGGEYETGKTFLNHANEQIKRFRRKVEGY